MSAELRRGLAALLLVALGGCAGPARIERTELPDAPLLVSYLNPEQARQRVELLEALRRTRKRQQGILHLDDLSSLLGAGTSGLERAPARAARLARVDPREGRVTTLAGRLPGSRPLARSPDGSALLFSAPGRNGTFQLFVQRADSGEVRPVTQGPAAHPMGCFVADGRLAAVESRTASGRASAHLVVTEPAGGGVRPLTSGPYDVSPACSARAPSVAFVTGCAQRGRVIAVIDLDGRAAPRIVARGQDPVFTPDGRWIVYSARTSQGLRLWRMRPDGSGKLPLGEGRGDELRPAVSPDGRFVAYLALEEQRLRLRVRRFDGSGDRLLLDRGDVLHAMW